MTNYWLSALLAVALIAPLQAAEQKEDKKTPEKKPAIEKEKEKNSGKKPTIFKPSEELSEDYSVPFPVDI